MMIAKLPPNATTVVHPISGVEIVTDGKLRLENILASWEKKNIPNPTISHPMLALWWDERKPEFEELVREGATEFAWDTLLMILETCNMPSPARLLEMLKASTKDLSENPGHIRNRQELIKHAEEALAGQDEGKFPMGVTALDGFIFLIGPEDNERAVMIRL